MSQPTEVIYLGGGCFWCTEAAFQIIKGVKSVMPGYAGGSVPDPSYKAVSTGKTGHAEVVKVEFDPSQISLDEILDIFWSIHNPTTLNRQGADIGTQYRSIILYENKDQELIIRQSIDKVAQLWDGPIVTELKPLDRFYPAEEYHQSYFKKDPSRAYCQLVINPKLKKLRENYQRLLNK